MLEQETIIFDPTIDMISSISNMNNKIHIRIKQRNRRKNTTTIENLPVDMDLEPITKKMKQTFHCNASVHTTDEGKYIQLFGDQRSLAKKFLMDNKISEESNIIIHGY